MKNKVLSFLLIVSLVLGTLPLTAMGYVIEPDSVPEISIPNTEEDDIYDEEQDVSEEVTEEDVVEEEVIEEETEYESDEDEDAPEDEELEEEISEAETDFEEAEEIDEEIDMSELDRLIEFAEDTYNLCVDIDTELTNELTILIEEARRILADEAATIEQVQWISERIIVEIEKLLELIDLAASVFSISEAGVRLEEVIALAERILADEGDASTMDDIHKLESAISTAIYILNTSSDEEEVKNAASILREAINKFKLSTVEVLYSQSFNGAVNGATMGGSTDTRYDSWGITSQRFAYFEGKEYDQSDIFPRFVSDRSTASGSALWRNLSGVGLNSSMMIMFDIKLYDFNAARRPYFRSGSGNSTAHGNMLSFDKDGYVTFLEESSSKRVIDNEWHTYSFELYVDYPSEGVHTIKAYMDDVLIVEKTYTNLISGNYLNYIDFFQEATSSEEIIGEMGVDNFYVTTIMGYIDLTAFNKKLAEAEVALAFYGDKNPAASALLEAAIAEAKEVQKKAVDKEIKMRQVNEAKNQLENALYIFNMTVIPAEDFDIMREKMVTQLGVAVIGTEDNDLTDPIVRSEIAALEESADSLLSTIITDENRTEIWPNIKPTMEGDKYKDGVFITNTVRNLKTLALAYNQPGNKHYNDEALKNIILSAYDFVLTNWYCIGTDQTGNWWDWQIGIPKHSLAIFLIMFDEISMDKRIEYLVAYDNFQLDEYEEKQTGANRADMAEAQSKLGILAFDSEKIHKATAAISRDLVYHATKPTGSGNANDGFYPDGSYLQHQNVAYTGSYGKELLTQIINYKIDFAGTEWAISGEFDEFIYDIVYNTYSPLIYNGKMMDMVNGRAIVRKESNVTIGYEIMGCIYKLSVVSDGEDKVKLQSMLKQWLMDEGYYFGRAGNPYLNTSIPAYLRIFMRDGATVATAGQNIFNKAFAMMDRVVHTGRNFGFGLSMFSNRVLSYEQTGEENLKGWYTGSGMTYIYNDDSRQYTDGYWYTVDMYRMPGTTVTNEPRVTTRFRGEYRSQHDWVGASSLLGRYGSAGMMISQWNPLMVSSTNEAVVAANAKSQLSGKKSWFMFDNQIVALGAAIANTSQYDVETIVDNRMIDDDGAWNLIIDGTNELNNLSSTSQKFDNTTYAYIDADGNAASSVGYYFPNGASINALKEQRIEYRGHVDGSYTGDEYYSRNFATIWLDHGKNPTEASYEYVILPSMSIDEVSAYAENPSIEIIANTADVQAAKDVANGVLGVNFWNPEKVGIVKAFNPASVTMLEEGNYITLAVSDPTMKQDSIKIELDKGLVRVFSKDPNITVSEVGGKVSLTVNTSGAKGASLEVQLEVKEMESLLDFSQLNAAMEAAELALNNTTIYSVKAVKIALKAAINAAAAVSRIAVIQDELDKAVLDLESAMDLFNAASFTVYYSQSFDKLTIGTDAVVDGTKVESNAIRFDGWGVGNAAAAKGYLQFTGDENDQSDIYPALIHDNTGGAHTSNSSLWRGFSALPIYPSVANGNQATNASIVFDAKFVDGNANRWAAFRTAASLSIRILDFSYTDNKIHFLQDTSTKIINDGEWHTYGFDLLYNTASGFNTIIAYMDGVKVAEKVYAAGSANAGEFDRLHQFDFFQQYPTGAEAAVAITGFDNFYIGEPLNYSATTPSYEIALSETGTYHLGTVAKDYISIPELAVSVANAGTGVVKNLLAELSGEDAESFTITQIEPESLGANRTSVFSISPVSGLDFGSYTATVTVSGDDGTVYGNTVSQSFDVTFTVAETIYAISLNRSGTYDFGSILQGYAPRTPITAIVVNNGTGIVTNLSASVNGTDSHGFTITQPDSTLDQGASTTFTVVPNNNLIAGTYIATVKLTGDNGIGAEFDVRFTVNPYTYAVSLSPVGADVYNMGSVIEDYVSKPTLTVAVQNKGTGVVTGLITALSGQDANSFTLTQPDLSTLSFNAVAEFTVTPKDGLAAGVYNADITITANNGIDESFSVRFTVAEKEAELTYEITLDPSSPYIFERKEEGYASLTAFTITVRNTGTGVVDNLVAELNGTDAASFTLTQPSENSIANLETTTVTVVPKTGLAVGTYAATVIVTGDNSVAASFDVAFTVTGKDSSSNDSSSSGGGWTPTEPVPTPVAQKDTSKEIQDSIAKDKEPVIVISDKHSGATLSGKDMLDNAKLGRNLIIVKSNIQLTIVPNVLNTLNIKENSSIEITLAEGKKKINTQITDTLEKIDNINKALAETVYTISVKHNAKEIAKADQMIKVSVKVEDLKLIDRQKNNLTAVILNDEIGTYTHLGGEFSDDEKTFTFHSSHSGDYTLIVAENLKKVNMSMGTQEYTINGKQFTNDVAPVTIGDRAHMPLRAIAEALGAEVGWSEETETVTISNDEIIIELVIGKALPNGLGTPQIIGDRTFVPLRYIAEQLGSNVVWDEESNSIAIYK